MIGVIFAITVGVLLAYLFLSVGTPASLIVKAKKKFLWLIPYNKKYDVTDDPANNLRSGIAVTIDYGTGVQYLVTPTGGITPRLDSAGNVMIVND